MSMLLVNIEKSKHKGTNMALAAIMAFLEESSHSTFMGPFGRASMRFGWDGCDQDLISRPGRTQGLLYKHLRHSFIH